MTKRKATPRRSESLIRIRRRKTDGLLRMIRALAVKQQGSTPKLFLSLREASRRFAVPMSAMAAVYRRLSAEGILMTIRGSQTILQQRGRMRTLKVRGVIGLPVSIPRFRVMQDYRRCLFPLRDELRDRGFVASTIFSEQPLEQAHALISQFQKEKVDTVVWLLPDSADAETLLRLKDAGIRFVGINLMPLSGLQTRYQIGRQQAIRTIIQDWQNDPAISGATIIRLPHETKSDEERLAKLKKVIESEGMECEIATVLVRDLATFLGSVCQKSHHGVVLPAAPAALLGWHTPEKVTELLQSCRAALIDGAIDLPCAEKPVEAQVDLVTADWPSIVKEIASDIAKGDAFDDVRPTVFKATAHLRVPLPRYRQLGA